MIWNGNNENLWGYVQWGWRPLLAGRSWGNGYYRELFPNLLAELDPTRPYSPGSPFSFTDYLHPNDENNGTMHIWDVWNERDYTGYRDYTPRFVVGVRIPGPARVVHPDPRRARRAARSLRPGHARAPEGGGRQPQAGKRPARSPAGAGDDRRTGTSPPS